MSQQPHKNNDAPDQPERHMWPHTDAASVGWCIYPYDAAAIGESPFGIQHASIYHESRTLDSSAGDEEPAPARLDLPNSENWGHANPQIALAAVQPTSSSGPHGFIGEPTSFAPPADSETIQVNPHQAQLQYLDAQDHHGRLQCQEVPLTAQYDQQGCHVQSFPTQQSCDPPQQTFGTVTSAGRLQCRAPGCPLGPGGPKETVFKRRFELERHALKHSQQRFACPAINCRKQFYRPDKLKSHVRNGHDDDTLFACPVQECWLSFSYLARTQMGDHFHDSHVAVRQQYKHQFAALGYK